VIRAETMAAFLAAWQRGAACSWQEAAGHELRFLPHPVPMLQLLPGAFSAFRLREALSRRFLSPDRYDGCHLSVTAEGAPLLLYLLNARDVPQDAIATLYSLADAE